MGRLCRNPAVVVTEIEGEAFLVEPDGGEIFHLDAVTGGIWRLAGTPGAEHEILEGLAAALPGRPAGRLRAEGRRLLAELRRARLLLPT